MLGANSGIEQRQHAAIRAAANQPSKTLLQGEHSSRHLIIHEGVAAFFVDASRPRHHYWISWDRKRQPVHDHTAQLFAGNVHTLPETGGRKQHGSRLGTESVE